MPNSFRSVTSCWPPKQRCQTPTRTAVVAAAVLAAVSLRPLLVFHCLVIRGAARRKRTETRLLLLLLLLLLSCWSFQVRQCNKTGCHTGRTSWKCTGHANVHQGGKKKREKCVNVGGSPSAFTYVCVFVDKRKMAILVAQGFSVLSVSVRGLSVDMFPPPSGASLSLCVCARTCGSFALLGHT